MLTGSPLDPALRYNVQTIRVEDEEQAAAKKRLVKLLLLGKCDDVSPPFGDKS